MNSFLTSIDSHFFTQYSGRMSLTKKDLQAIGAIIDQKFDEKFDQKFDQKFGEKFDQKFDEKFKPIKKILQDMNKKLDTTIRFFDHSIVDHEKRIKRVEKHLELPPLVN